MRLLVFAVILFISVVSVANVQAQQYSFSLKPAQNRVIIKPGNTATIPYYLTNTGDPTVVSLKIYALSVKDSKGSYEMIPFSSDSLDFPQFNTSDSSLPLDTPFLISSNEAIEFDLIINIDSMVNERDYYFTLVSESEPAEGFEDTSRIILQGGVGSAIYISVTSNGHLKEFGEISLFDVQPQHSIQLMGKKFAVFDSYKPIPLLLTVSNKGERIFNTTGKIIVQEKYGSNSKSIQIAKHYVLANTQRVLQGIKSEGILEPENGESTILPGVFMGMYTAQAYVQIENQPTKQTEQIVFYIFPFKYTIISFFIIFIPFIVYLLTRYIKKK